MELTISQREVLEFASQATFANPFGARRYELDAALAGTPVDAPRERIVARMLARLDETWASFEGGVRYRDFTGEDRDRALHAMLFDTFIRFTPQFDALIEAQLEAGERSLPAPFAEDAMARLAQWGFTREEQLRFFGIMYQIARAFYFIDARLPGPSASMQALRQRLWRNIFTSDLILYENHMWSRMEDFATFLLGETGTGKGTVASALGMGGWIPFDPDAGRFAESFTTLLLPINLSQFTESLIESELFGHVKGAFTGAIHGHQGVFERCRRYGTIFLDEIGEVSVPVQIKLLNVLQDRAFSPVGSHERLRFEGRVVAATNRSIEEQRAEGTFRDDFFYRLCSDIIVMPTLRQRIQEDERELDILLDYIVERLVGVPSPRIVARVRDVIARRLGPAYPWHGNVRELEQCARRVILTGDYQPGASNRPRSEAAHLAAQMDRGELSVADLTAAYCRMLYQRVGTYEGVSQLVGLDRRTVKKYVQAE